MLKNHHTSHAKKKYLVLLIILATMKAFCQPEASELYIKQLSERLGRIKYASYYFYQSASVPGDTTLSLSYGVYKKEFIAPEDRFVGAYVASFDLNDTSKLEYFYDGSSKAYVDHANKVVPIDSFTYNPYPFRIVYPPFITFAKSLLKYAIETNDSISLSLSVKADTIIISLQVQNKLIEVVGNQILNAEIPDIQQAHTQYDIWILEPEKLPIKIVKKFPDRICSERCEGMKISETISHPFIASRYFPQGYRTCGTMKNAKEKSIVETVAPDWTLEDFNGNEISLSDFHSKILLIQFTGLGCGPCQLSIPFMKELSNEYNDSIFNWVIIETWSDNKPVIKKHCEKNDIQARYLIANSDIISNYMIGSVPTFVLLDKKRTIRNVITGFAKERTMQEIKTTLNKLLIE